MATSKATMQSRGVRAVVAQTGVTEREAIAVLEAKEWRAEEAILSIREQFQARHLQRVAERQLSS